MLTSSFRINWELKLNFRSKKFEHFKFFKGCLPQISLGPFLNTLSQLLANSFLANFPILYFKDVNIASYADDKILYDSCSTIEKVTLSLRSSSKKLFQWLSDKQIRRNAEKCRLIMSTSESVDIQLGSSLIVRSNCEKMLGVKIDYKLNFDKANNKLRELAKATPYTEAALHRCS